MAAFRGKIPMYGAALTFLAGLAGCVQLSHLPNPFHQDTPDEKLEKALDIGTVGDLTEVNNAGYIKVLGIGIVFGLDGAGGTAPGEKRAMLEQQLRKQKFERTSAILDDPNNALVLVKALLPPGVRNGEPIDVEIELPAESPATSLKGGFLADCPLSNFEDAKNLNPKAGSRFVQGHVLANAKGPLLVGLGNLEDEKALKRARVWGGASSRINRPYYFVLTNDGLKRYDVANSIAARLNSQFRNDPKKLDLIRRNRNFIALDDVTKQFSDRWEGGFGKGEIARATDKKMITVGVPYAYRFNQERFLRVARLLPLSSPPDVMHVYRTQLETILLDKKHTMRAALRLEALGKDSIPILKKGLASPEPLVRFCSAESLSYLDSPAGIEDLAKLAIDQPDLRAYALLAIAGLDESICRQKLGELMTVDDPELPCGAYRSLALMDDSDPRLGGEEMGSFTLHKVAKNSAPFVTFGTGKRAEVVIFGPEVTMKTPLKTWAAGGEYIVTAERNDDRITVSRVNAKGALKSKQCPLTLEDALRSMVELGAGYPDVVDLLKNLNDERALPCQIRELTTPATVGLEVILQADLKEARVPLVD